MRRYPQRGIFIRRLARGGRGLATSGVISVCVCVSPKGRGEASRRRVIGGATAKPPTRLRRGCGVRSRRLIFTSGEARCGTRERGAERVVKGFSVGSERACKGRGGGATTVCLTVCEAVRGFCAGRGG